jgi:predicted metalloprotease
MRLGGGIGLGGLALVLLAGWLFGADPHQLLVAMTDGGGQRSAPRPTPTGVPADDEAAAFVATVLADTEDTWSRLVGGQGETYRPPTLVLFDDRVESACGLQSAAVGPVYGPLDGASYLDLRFFSELSQRFGAPGDFAHAYVIAHEVGHHLQNLLGISDEVSQRRASVGTREGNQLSVRLELQADCLAGVWGHHAGRRDLLEPGDVDEGLRAAAAIGDDTLQRRSQGTVQPESWTHGSSAQRNRWLRRGLDSGDVAACDTFSS